MPYLVNTVLLIALCKFAGVLSLPEVACPHLFEYVRDGDEYFGIITLSNLPCATIVVDVRIVQAGSLPSEYIGSFTTEEDIDTVNRQLNRGEPIKYRLDFPLPNDPPKLLRIAVNDNEICNAPSIPPPSATVDTQHTFYPVPTFKPPRPRPRPRPRPIPTYKDDSNFVTERPFAHQPPTTVAVPSYSDATCGKEWSTPTTFLTPLIYGGIPLSRGQFPWLSAIYSNSRFMCGGSLISRRTVVTAAHCFLKLSSEDVVVYLGRYDLGESWEDGYVSRSIANLMLHPHFVKSAPTPDADIAILQLDRAVEYTEYIAPICLWSGPDEIDQIAGNFGTVAGWGSQESGVAMSQQPLSVDINISRREECIRYSDFFRLRGTTRTFCAGNGNDTGPCKGDSGSGFMIQRNDVWMLRGIVSVGPTLRGKCNLKEYVIYCDVAKHMSWIKNNMV